MALLLVQFSSVQSLSCVRLFAIPWIAARQASLSITNSPSLLKLMFTESVMPSNHLILCRPLLLLPSIFPSIRVFSHQVAKALEFQLYPADISSRASAALSPWQGDGVSISLVSREAQERPCREPAPPPACNALTPARFSFSFFF